MNSITNAYVSTATSVLGTGRKVTEEWISRETWEVIEEWKVSKVKLLNAEDENTS